MTDKAISTPKRLLRALLGGAILATAWLAVDLVTHSDAASAAELPDRHISDITTVGSDTVSEVVTPVVVRLASIADRASTEPVSAVEEAEAVVAEAVTAIVSTPLEAVAPVVDGLVTAPALPPITGVVDALPGIPALPAIPTMSLPSAGLLLSGGALAIGVALAASTLPLLPTPVGGVPRDPPTVQTPSYDAAAAVPNSASLAPPGSALRSRALAGGTPPSPTYGFDTTPD